MDTLAFCCCQALRNRAERDRGLRGDAGRPTRASRARGVITRAWCLRCTATNANKDKNVMLGACCLLLLPASALPPPAPRPAHASKEAAGQRQQVRAPRLSATPRSARTPQTRTRACGQGARFDQAPCRLPIAVSSLQGSAAVTVSIKKERPAHSSGRPDPGVERHTAVERSGSGSNRHAGHATHRLLLLWRALARSWFSGAAERRTFLRVQDAAIGRGRAYRGRAIDVPSDFAPHVLLRLCRADWGPPAAPRAAPAEARTARYVYSTCAPCSACACPPAPVLAVQQAARARSPMSNTKRMWHTPRDGSFTLASFYGTPPSGTPTRLRSLSSRARRGGVRTRLQQGPATTGHSLAPIVSNMIVVWQLAGTFTCVREQRHPPLGERRLGQPGRGTHGGHAGNAHGT